MNQPNVKVALIGAAGVLLAAVIGYLAAVRPVQISISATQTAEARIATSTATTPPGTGPTITPTIKPTTPLNPARSVVYDAFDSGCVGKSRWGIYFEKKNAEVFLPTPSAECWTLDGSFTVSQNELRFHPTSPGSQGNSYLIANALPAADFTYLETAISVKRASGATSGVGLFTRMNDADRSWAYYYLEFGNQLESSKSRVVYSSPDGKKTYGETILTAPYEARLGIWWDGAAMHFFLNGVETLPAVPYSGIADTIGLYWIVGANSTLDVGVSEVRVIYP